MYETALRLILTVALLSASCAVVPAQKNSQCLKPESASQSGFWFWPQNARIKVFAVTGAFRAEELPFLLAPLRNWNAIADRTTSGVTFGYQGEVQERQMCQNCLTIARGDVFSPTRRHATEFHAYSARSNRVITHAAIVIDLRLKNLEAVGDAVAHELGHSFGLNDCFDCPSGKTVMNQFRVLNLPNRVNGPTASDIAQIRKFYQNLLAQARACPAIEGTDEGEEPVDDDSPVVIPQP